MITYAVYAKGTDRDQLLGFATGQQEDIAAYFDDRKGYGIYCNAIKPVNIPSGYAIQRAKLIAQRQELERQIREIDSSIKLTL